MIGEVAEGIVRSWLSDGQTKDFQSAWNAADMGFLPDVKTRRFIASRNVLANNAMWDGKPNTAYVLLTKHGLSDRKKRARGTPNWRYEESSYKSAILGRKLRSVNNYRHSRSAWNVCKP